MIILEDLSYKIRKAIFAVANELGPGLLESTYQEALTQELVSAGVAIKTEVPVSVNYKGIDLGVGYRIDVLVEDSVVLEIKSVDYLHDVHKKQLLTYLRLANKRLGMLINFNVELLEDKKSLIRIVN